MLLNKLWWGSNYILAFFILITIVLSKITHNNWIIVLCIYLTFILLVDNNIEKATKGKWQLRETLVMYISIALIGALLIILFNDIGLILATISLILIAIKITWEAKREEREKDNIKYEKKHKKRYRQRRDIINQRIKQREKEGNPDLAEPTVKPKTKKSKKRAQK